MFANVILGRSKPRLWFVRVGRRRGNWTHRASAKKIGQGLTALDSSNNSQNHRGFELEHLRCSRLSENTVIANLKETHNMIDQVIIESGAGMEKAPPQPDLGPDDGTGVATARAIEGSLELSNAPISNDCTPTADSKPGVLINPGIGEKLEIDRVRFLCPFYANLVYVPLWIAVSGRQEATALAAKLRPSFNDDLADNFDAIWDIEIIGVDEVRTGVAGHIWTVSEIASAGLEARISTICEKMEDERMYCVRRALAELSALFAGPPVDNQPE